MSSQALPCDSLFLINGAQNLFLACHLQRHVLEEETVAATNMTSFNMTGPRMSLEKKGAEAAQPLTRVELVERTQSVINKLPDINRRVINHIIVGQHDWMLTEDGRACS